MSRKLSERIHSLKFRLMTLITLMLLLVVGIPVGFFVYQLDKNYKEFSINMIETTSQVVYQFIYDGMMKNDTTLIQDHLVLLGMDPAIRLLRLYRPQGSILYSTNLDEINKNVYDLSDDMTFKRDDAGEIESFVRKDNIYSHHHPIYVQQECSPCHTNVGELIAILDVHAGFTSSEFMYNSSKNLAIFGGLIIIAILWVLLNLLYQSQVEARLNIIMSGFEKVSKGNFNFKLKMLGRHELARLSNKFNQMVENLKSARQKEEQFIQEKLERADRLVTLGEVAAEIAHEVNNPAGIILTRAEFLKEEMLEKNSDSVCIDDLDIIVQQTEKIAETTRSILHYSRKLPHVFSEIDLSKIIKHSIKILQPRISKSKIEINLNLPDKPAVIWGNSNQLEQVFCNLLNNSLDFLDPEKGLIKINIQTDIKNNKNSHYRIIFQDNGPGVPAQFSEKIFTPFFTTKQNDEGTGLGLFIVKNIISNHHGTIELDNEINKGVRFIIDLEAYHG